MAATSEAQAKSSKPATVFTMLENNPEVMNSLARSLGVSPKLRFCDVWSFSDPDLLALIPRPVYALLITAPMAPAWKRDRDAEDARSAWYAGSGPDEPVIWFRQTIVAGCGLIGLLHCLSNGEPGDMVDPGSELAGLLKQAVPLDIHARAQLLNDYAPLHVASEAAAQIGDTKPLPPGEHPSGNHFIAFVKGRDGHLWELEGSRKGPVDRGALAVGEDLLSEKALDLGIQRIFRLHGEAVGTLPFSCIALGLAPAGSV